MLSGHPRAGRAGQVLRRERGARGRLGRTSWDAEAWALLQQLAPPSPLAAADSHRDEESVLPPRMAQHMSPFVPVVSNRNCAPAEARAKVQRAEP